MANDCGRFHAEIQHYDTLSIVAPVSALRPQGAMRKGICTYNLTYEK
jgi:hypothetical protein